MQLSKHNYSNTLMDSLLDNLSENIVAYIPQKKVANTQNITGNDIFSTTTIDTLRSIQEDRLNFIASELEFAADKSKVSINGDDLVRFAQEVVNKDLRGKKLERFASKFCSELAKEVAPPQGQTRVKDIQHNNASTILPAGYDPKYGPNDTKTGGYMGMSKNPCSIWDCDAIVKLAQKKTGDEIIKESKAKEQEFRLEQKKQFWQEIKDKCSSSELLQKKLATIAHSGGQEAPSNNPKLPANAMSMFNKDRDFNNIPETTSGENFKQASSERGKYKENSRSDWDKMSAAQKINNIPSVFDRSTQNETQDMNIDTNKVNSHRASIDKLFDGLIDKMGL